MASDSKTSQSSKLESEEAAADTNPAWKGASKRRQKKAKETKKEARAKKEIFDSSPKDDETARIIRDKIMVYLDINFMSNKPLFLTGGGIFIFDQPIQWLFIRKAEMLEDGTPVYDRAYQSSRMDFSGRKSALSCAKASEPEIEYYDQYTGAAKKLKK